MHQQGYENYIKHLKTNLTNGLEENEDQIEQRKKVYGDNKKEMDEPTGICALLIEPLKDPILGVLMVAAVISMTLGYFEQSHAGHPNPEVGSFEGIAIWFAVAIVTGVTAWNDYNKEKQFRKLQEAQDKQNHQGVTRNGVTTQEDRAIVVVGDLINIKIGDQICADGIVVEANDIEMDEAAITGESDLMMKVPFDLAWPDVVKTYKTDQFDLEALDVQKAESPKKQDENVGEEGNEKEDKKGGDSYFNKHTMSPIVISGTMVQKGSGKYIAIAVGPLSSEGKIAESLKEKDDEKTPLQEKLEIIAKLIGFFGLGAAVAVVAIVWLRLIIEMTMFPDPNATPIGTAIKFLSILIVGVTVLVVAIPEGLPLAVTLSLA